MSTETNKQKARNFLETTDRQDFEAFLAALAPNMVAHVNGGPAMSREEFEGMGRMMVAAFADTRHIIESQVAEGDRVATRLTWTARHVGDFNGIAATNRSISISGSAYDLFENGKIIEHHAQFDMLAIMMQIGAIPAAA